MEENNLNNDKADSKFARYLKREMARRKSRTPEQRQADKERECRPGIFISREELEELRQKDESISDSDTEILRGNCDS